MKSLVYCRWAMLLSWMIVSVAAEAFGQTTTPSFDVTSVKINKTGTTRQSIGSGPGPCCTRVVATNATFRMLLRYSYPTFLATEIVGGPDWVDTQRFDVEGKIDAAQSPVSNDQTRLMLRSLLEDRFGLKAHLEKRDTPQYYLIPAREHPRLKISSIAPAD